MDKAEVSTKLARHIISSATYPEAPRSLDGEILLEEHRAPDGRLLGVVSVSVDVFLALPDQRPDQTGKRLADLPVLEHAALKAFDPKDQLGYHKYLDKWKEEGLM